MCETAIFTSVKGDVKRSSEGCTNQKADTRSRYERNIRFAL
ncbi:hypothetical protein HMPREF1990_00802 [Porphyromonas gingivalis W4087]|nr:hypothetical protein HMPREF1990_00802 [Porphyromonas gingivalis W4087]